MLALSFLFYGWWDPRFLPVLGLSIAVNWLAARRFVDTGHRRILTAAIVFDLLLLALLKYADFITANLSAYRAAPIGLPIPLGISFFTFHHIMYLVDLRRRRAKFTTLDRYALLIAFFPQALAGPLARWTEVGHQFGRPMFEPGWERRWSLALTLIVVGLAEKVLLGDPLGQILDPVYAEAANQVPASGSAWLAPAFALQVFFDFSGYSDIAIGTALLFAVELPINFNAPFRACSIIDFWQRWHMTLSRFLRDYVFLPLSDLRIGSKRHSPAHFVLAILVTMTLCGLWHGAGWTFVCWGLLQGIAIVFALGWRRRFGPPARALGWMMTVLFFMLTSVLFRAGSLDTAAHIYAGLSHAPAWQLLTKSWLIAAAGLLAVLLPPSQQLAGIWSSRRSRIVPVALGLLGLVILVQLGGTESYDFIYFQF